MKVLIIGAGYAGVTAALRLARAPLVEVTLVNPTDRFVERIRLHEQASGRKPKERALHRILAKSGVRLILGHVESIDTAACTATVSQHQGAETTRVPWDRLMLAVGSRTQFAVPGARANALCLDGDGAQKIAKALKENLARDRHQVLVVGGGLTGIEVASELAESHPKAKVTLLSRGPLLREYSSAAQAYAKQCLQQLGVHVETNSDISELRDDRAISSQREFRFDLCVWSAGFKASSLPSGLDVARDSDGRIEVNADLSSVTHANIFAVGDCAKYSQTSIPGGCKSAGPAAAQAADNILCSLDGREAVPFQFRAPGFCISLGRKRGIIQWTAFDGSLRGPVTLGRPAALIKELICRLTVWSFTLERLGLMSYAVSRPKELPAPHKQLTHS